MQCLNVDLQNMLCHTVNMNIGYGIKRHVSDFASAKLDTFAPLDNGRLEPRVWIDADKNVRPELTQMLMGLTDKDTVFVVSMSDLGSKRDQALNARKVTLTGAALEVIKSNQPAPEPRKPGPKSKWADIDAETLKGGADKWHNPNQYTWWAALKVFHDAGHKWVKRHNINDNLGTRNAPKSKEKSE
jgi:hypothetical protein